MAPRSVKILEKKFKGLVQPEDYKLIPLTKGKFAKVDNEDFEHLSQHCWSVTSNGYCENHTFGLMHRYIMNPPEGMVVDHRNPEDTLDNRRDNLRVCTYQQNGFNSRAKRGQSIYKGVSWYKAYKKWAVAIESHGTRIFVGYFDDDVEAALAYDAKAKELHGEFAYLNFQ